MREALQGLDFENAPLLTQDAVGDAHVDQATFITLNHDLVLEDGLLRSPGASSAYDDGFDGALDGLGTWNIESGGDIRNWSRRVQLIKIHGSIDWWSPAGWNDGGLVYRSRDHPGTGCAGRPLFSVGTGPKLFQSSNLIFARQVLDAAYALARATCVVVIGYGFGDVRMNSLWNGASDLGSRGGYGHRFPTLVIDPEADALLGRLELLKRAGNLHEWFGRPDVPVELLQRRAEDVDWAECKELLLRLHRG